MRRFVIVMASALCMALPAAAFEKTASGKPGEGRATTAKPLDLSTGKSLETEGSGTVVRIPGLGALGVLPKLDFGLELLYGDSQPQAVAPQEEEPDTDGLRIRGTLKHRF